MDDLVPFLRARLDEDHAKITAMQREITRVRLAPINQGRDMSWLGGIDLFVNPDRWAAEVQAKRAILDLAENWSLEPDEDGWMAPADRCFREVVLALGLPHAHHPDYQEAWRP